MKHFNRFKINKKWRIKFYKLSEIENKNHIKNKIMILKVIIKDNHMKMLYHLKVIELNNKILFFILFFCFNK